jgi:hypothetical protein
MSWELAWINSEGKRKLKRFNASGARYVIQMAFVLSATDLFLRSGDQVLVHIKFHVHKVSHRTLGGWAQVARGLLQIIGEELRNE